jgi:steroid delta-isomerase-like uncharacterized protein
MAKDQDKDLVRRFVREVFVEGRSASVDELVAEDFRSHTWGPDGLGKDGLKMVTVRMAGVFTDVDFVVEDLIAENDRVVARLTASGTQVGEFMGLPSSGKRYTIGEIHIFRMAHGRIVEHWHQYDRAGMLRQLGAQD